MIAKSLDQVVDASFIAFNIYIWYGGYTLYGMSSILATIWYGALRYFMYLFIVF